MKLENIITKKSEVLLNGILTGLTFGGTYLYSTKIEEYGLSPTLMSTWAWLRRISMPSSETWSVTKTFICVSSTRLYTTFPNPA